MAELAKHVLEDMNKQLDRIEKSLTHLNDELVWTRMKDSMNSIAISACIWRAAREF